MRFGGLDPTGASQTTNSLYELDMEIHPAAGVLHWAWNAVSRFLRASFHGWVRDVSTVWRIYCCSTKVMRKVLSRPILGVRKGGPSSWFTPGCFLALLLFCIWLLRASMLFCISSFGVCLLFAPLLACKVCIVHNVNILDKCRVECLMWAVGSTACTG